MYVNNVVFIVTRYFNIGMKNTFHSNNVLLPILQVLVFGLDILHEHLSNILKYIHSLMTYPFPPFPKHLSQWSEPKKCIYIKIVWMKSWYLATYKLNSRAQRVKFIPSKAPLSFGKDDYRLLCPVKPELFHCRNLGLCISKFSLRLYLE